MRDFNDFQQIQSLCESSRSLVLRVLDRTDGRPVILKIAREGGAGDGGEQLRQEFGRLQSVPHPHVIQVHQLLQTPYGIGYSMEDIGGRSLAEWQRERPFTVAELLPLMLQLTDALETVHLAGYSHRDVNPSNLICNPARTELRLIDFGLAGRNGSQVGIAQSPAPLQGTLLYLAPEQTGRVGRPVDHRSDFYSLGATLYQLICGHAPFAASDYAEMVHAQIARTPQPARQRNATVSHALSAVLDKLLAKAPEDRYQSAAGLRHDLNYCLQLQQANSDDPAFVAGRSDHAQKLTLPHKLFGREAELGRLQQAITRAAAGERQCVLVSGEPGIGKSFLVNASRAAVERQHGWFAQGKFDLPQFRRPYAAIRQLCQQLVLQVLAEKPDTFEQLRQQLQAQLGQLGSELQQQLPELQALLGYDAVPTTSQGDEAQNRVADAFQRLIRQLQQQRQPLVFFIDDLQWADHASLGLLEALLADPECLHLCLIVSCRNGELVSGSKSEAFWRQLQQAGTATNQIAIGPLSDTAVREWLAEALQRPSGELGSLTQLVLRKTGGNPFFIRQFISLAGETQLFRYADGWQWDEASLQTLTATDNVIDLTIAHLQTLPAETCSLLGCAACLGNECDTGLLARANLLSEAVLAQQLQPALDTDAIVLQGMRLRFTHDRICEALQTMYGDTQRQIWHARLGQLLVEQADSDTQQLITAVTQLNLGQEKLPDNWRAKLAGMNRLAAASARADNDFDLATDFYAQAASLLPSESWNTDHANMLALHIDWAEAAFLAGHYQSAKNLFVTLHSHAQALDDRVHIATSEILFYEKTHLFQKAVDTAGALLRELQIDMPLPEQIDGPRSLAQVQRLQANLQRVGIHHLAELPPASEQRIHTAVELLMSVTVPYWVTYPHAFPYVVIEAANLSLEHGLVAGSANALGWSATALCAGFQEYELGYQLGEAALALPGEPSQFHDCQRRFLFHNMVRVFRDPPLAGMAELLDACHRGIEAGNRQYASYCINHYCLRGLLAGMPLPQVSKAQQQLAPAMYRMQQEDAFGLFDSVRQVVAQLQQSELSPLLLRGEFFDETEALPRYQRLGHNAAIALAIACKLLLMLVADEFEAAARLADENEGMLNAPTGQLQTEFGLCCAAVAWLHRDRGNDRERAIVVEQRLLNLEQHNPAGIAPFRLLLSALLQQAANQQDNAARLFEQAVAAAAAITMLHWLALSSTLAARHWQTRGFGGAAIGYELVAQQAWRGWGAPAIEQRLQRQQPLWLQNLTSRRRPDSQNHAELATDSSSVHISHRHDSLDLAAVAKMNQAIVAELVLDKLLAKLLHVALENGGAEAASLLLPVDGQLLEAARCSADTQQTEILRPYAEPSSFPQAALRYCAGTQQPLLLEDLQHDPVFGNEGLNGALLLVPLVLQQQLRGMVCLSHQHLPGAFRPQHLALLQLLSSQMAIALDNALLYQHLTEHSRTLQENYQALQQANAARDRAEARMAKLANAVEQAADAVVITNRDGVIEYVNLAFERITGYCAAEALGQTPRLLKSGQHSATFYQRMWKTLLEGKPFSDMLINRRKDGTLYYEERTITPLSLKGEGISHFVATGKDITERLQTEQRLHHLATHDALTGLPNRNLFVEQLKLALAATQWHQRCVAVMVIDLDRFKLINDTLGHEGGDEVLTTLAERIKQHAGQSDAVARFGGAEFALMLNGIAGPEELPAYAERLLAGLSQPVQVAGRDLVVTASIGISISPHDSGDAQELLRNAHAAMHRAKTGRGNSWQFFTADLNTVNFERLELETLLRQSLQQRRFSLVFQPQVRLSDRVCVGMEALLRWQHPSGHAVSPAQFIPLLEETGLIVPVGTWVIEESCRRAAEWVRLGLPPLRMSVNIAAQQLQQGDLPTVVASCLRQSGLAPQWLELELTESSLIERQETTGHQLQQPRDLGVRLAIDDFGTGYSSLSYLRHFPVNTLKIDQSFIRSLPQVREDVALVRSIVALGEGLGLEIVAEGIETEQQAAFLAEFPGLIAQGFLFYRPQPFEQLLQAGLAA